MKFEEWLVSVPAELTGDPLWQVKVYRFAVFMGDLAWEDSAKLVQDKRMIGLADQLYRAVGSIGANIAEGYGRQSGRDQARFYEYALGSTREARGWYYQGRHILSDAVATHRMQLLTQIARLLLTIIPAERGSKLRDKPASYEIVSSDLLDDPPMPSA